MTRQLKWACALPATLASLLAVAPTWAADLRDLSGTWTNASKTSLQRPEGVTALEVGPAEAKQLADARLTNGQDAAEQARTRSDPNEGLPPVGDKDFGVKAYDAGWTADGETLDVINGRYRTSHIIDPADGRLPYRDPERAKSLAAARRVAYATGKGPYDGPEQADLGERCILSAGGTGGPGMLHVIYNNNYQFVLTKDHLAINVEMVHDVRIIPIFASAKKARASHGPIDRWLGDSVGWWRDRTLVVETTRVPPAEGAFGQFPLSPKAVVTEFFTRTGPTEIHYKFTVDDPINYTRPWTAELMFRPINAIYEYACHEGNYGLEGMLAGARATDAAVTSVGRAP